MRVNQWRRDFILRRPEYVLGDEMEQVGKKMRPAASKPKNARAIMKIWGNWGRLFQTWTQRQGTGNNQLGPFALIGVARAERLPLANANSRAVSDAPDFGCSLEPISISQRLPTFGFSYMSSFHIFHLSSSHDWNWISFCSPISGCLAWCSVAAFLRWISRNVLQTK